MPALNAKQITQHLTSVPDWSKRAKVISRTFQFEGFLAGLDFVNKIGSKAQKMNHHPDIDIRYNKVTLKLTTHDQGGLTQKDFSLAKICDETFNHFFGS